MSPNPNPNPNPSPTPNPNPTPTPNPNPPAASNAKPIFDADVAPIIMTTCAGAGCHSAPGQSPPRFIATTAAQEYDTVLLYADRLVASTFDKTQAQMLLKIQAGHYTASYTAVQVTKISGWLDAEVAARAGTTPTVNVRRQLMSEWSGCMTQTDWDAEGVAVAWAQKGTNQGQCQQCHVNAQGFLATQDSTRMFNILTTQPNPKGGMYMEYYFTPDVTTDPAKPKMVINRALMDRAAKGEAQHPTFTVDNLNDDNDAYSKLMRFYDKTMAKVTAKTCAAPKFMP
jgi:hypothetical protein